MVVEDLISCTSVILSTKTMLSCCSLFELALFSECLVLISVIIMAGVVFTVHDSRT